MNVRHGFGFALCDWRVDIFADDAAVLDLLDRYVLPWLPRTVPGSQASASVFEILRACTGFDLLAEGRRVASSPTAEGIIPLLQNWLDDTLVSRLSETVPLHAGAVARDGAAIVLPGLSHAGKSTLVRELLRRGFTYFSDEYALIDRTGRLHAYPRALMLRDEEGEVRPALASDWNASTGHAPARVALIAALNYRAGAAWRVERLQQSEMLLTLLKNTPWELRESPPLVEPLFAATAGALCYSGVRGEAAEAAARLAALLAECV
jgi:hypothetical protein